VSFKQNYVIGHSLRQCLPAEFSKTKDYFSYPILALFLEGNSLKFKRTLVWLKHSETHNSGNSLMLIALHVHWCITLPSAAASNCSTMLQGSSYQLIACKLTLHLADHQVTG